MEQGKLYGMLSVDILRALMGYYGQQGYKKIVYKAVPWIYHRIPAQDDLYALFRLGGRCVRRELSATIDTQEPRVMAERRKRGLARARKAELTVERDPSVLKIFWPILEDNLDRKHGARPAHTLAEMTDLIERFPDNIEVIIVRQGSQPCAGVVLFKSKRVIHAQYIATSDFGYSVAATEFLFEEVIHSIPKDGQRYFDFGTSNEAAGWVLNMGLYQFKREFGAGGCVYEHYDLDCEKVDDSDVTDSQAGMPASSTI
ncbi:MAG: GNAT family N-acetyltransferase [Acidiferrobacter sp.]